MLQGEEDIGEDSPCISMYGELQGIHPNWRVDIGEPRGMGSIRGTDLTTAVPGPFIGTL